MSDVVVIVGSFFLSFGSIFLIGGVLALAQSCRLGGFRFFEVFVRFSQLS